jgi:CRISPR-associated protein Csm1
MSVVGRIALTFFMSLQVFLQAQLLGASEFLSSGAAFETGSDGVGTSNQNSSAELIGRSAWLSLFCEVLPRGLLAELKLSNLLLGSSSAEQFLIVLAEEEIDRMEALLGQAAEGVRKLSGNTLQLIWATTENLGAWPVARKRLDDALDARTATPLAGQTDTASSFAPLQQHLGPLEHEYFENFAHQLSAAATVGWSAESPALLTWDKGQYTWTLKEQSGFEDNGIPFPRRFALDDDGNIASAMEVAERADGTPRWGVLCGDIDQFAAYLKSVGTVEDHIHLSVLFKEFFAGELSVLCTLPEFFRKISILYRGGDDFLVWGSWDGLLLLARELQRVFERFVEQNKDAFPGIETRTLSMALAIAPAIDAPVASVFHDAFVQVKHAKAIEPGTFYIFGRAIEWQRLPEAEEVKNSLVRLVREHGFAPEYINDLAAVYREAFAGSRTGRRKAIRVDKPWRTYMRLSRVIPQARNKEVNTLRNAAITSLIGKRTAGLKLRPSARVGLEWARLAAGAPV